MNGTPRLVTTGKELESLVDALSSEEAVALDTEFHGENRYWPDLYLVQLAGSQGPVAVDPVAIKDMSPLGTLLESPHIIKVMHSAKNDIEVLSHHLGVSFASVFDTQLAAAFLGFERQISLARLVNMECGVEQSKGNTLSDWSRRPLGKDQVDYALDDVRFLLTIRRNQVRRLSKFDRLRWYEQEAESLTKSCDDDTALLKAFRKIKARSKVKRDRLALLWALVKWREKEAMNLNRPRSFIMKDHVLGAVAALAPVTPEGLSSLRDVTGGFMDRWGEEIVRIVRESLRSPRKKYPRMPRNNSEPGVSARKDILRIFLKQESKRLGIAPELLVSKELLDSLAKSPPSDEEELDSLMELSGWRKEALGYGIFALLKGELALKISPGKGSNGLEFVRIKD